MDTRKVKVREVKPIRLQRSRKKGTKVDPSNGLKNKYVGAPSKWSNPWRKRGKQIAYDTYKNWLLNGDGRPLLKDLPELSGCNLVCWCGLDEEFCHANLLLILANPDIFSDEYAEATRKES